MLDSGSTRVVVLLASVLKPVDDTRMRGKFAKTLLERPNFEVHVAGRGMENDPEAKAVAENSRIRQHTIFRGSRLSLNRLAAQGRYWQLLQALQPALVVVHAPELLPITLLWQGLKKGRKFLYDVRENYALNVTTQRVYGGLTRRLLAAGLHWVEGLAAKRAAGLLLAEASYADELPYLKKSAPGRVLILENKYQPAASEQLPTQPRKLPPANTRLEILYSGTISELNGVWEAIALSEELHRAWPGGARLTIIGFCQQPDLLRCLQDKAAQHPDWLVLIGGATLVPHEQIVAAITRSHLGLLAYRPHPSTERCRPTKLFEYLAHGLPILSTSNALWVELLEKYGAGLPLDFAQPINGPAVVQALQRQPFYPDGVPTEVLWEGEGKKLWPLLDSVI